ncbi:extracellular protein precursor [Loigolactobacillus bifermentans DSM 20003]|jgi:uncharacterized protein YpmB|uniref:Extracellular protein n=2 Tax=Loigolactobacillus bifermentans TaxID=1607 RepID=A0A0R1GJX2_9LACO|nr:extracellular protein precursor [Loigolactobacillus bifermentans DSM 20003]QGG61788.1 hypothetical protein LB003_02490 [Loigolactobacillus bifermentans]
MRKRWKAYLVLGIILVVVFGTGFVFHRANRPMNVARKEAVTLAERYGHLKKVDSFTWFNRDQSYFTVAGDNQKNVPVYVIIAQHGGKIQIVRQSAGLSRNSALKKIWSQKSPQKVYNIALGIYHKKIAWEISYKAKNGALGYETIDFKTSKVLKVVENL